ncbi:EAL domain-containing protein [Agarivorans sp. QJM3NY_29]|uniref:EAL domain-containing protein n=1 Tax=unclassified Agarivorans TaxID=2636026 RepID=UPI003D7C7667
MLNPILFSASHSQYGLTKPSTINIVLLTSLIVFILSLIIHAIIMSISLDTLRSYSFINFTRAEQVAFHLQTGLNLAQTPLGKPCSEPDLSQLNEIKQTYFFIGDLGRIKQGKIICTAQQGILSHPYDLSLADAITADGTHYWNSQTDLFRTQEDQPIIGLNSTVAFISTPFLILTRQGYFNIRGMGGVIYAEAEQRYIYSYYGELLPRTIEPTITHKNSWVDWLPLPGHFITYTHCNQLYNLCVTSVDMRLGLYKFPIGQFLIISAIIILLSISVAIMIESFRVGPRAFVRRLKKQICRDHIYPVYQPQIDLETKTVIGVESLARWNDPKLGMVSPEVFIRVAESSGLIETLTKKMVSYVFREMSTTLEKFPSLTVSLNVSAELLSNDSFITFLNHQTAKYNFQRKQIVLEITETTTNNNDKMSRFSKELKQQGYLVSIDDFGTGLSNLSWLSTLEPTELKVDKIFTQAIHTETVNSISMEGIFSMLDHLQVQVVFEGIETEQQLAYIYDRVPDAIGQGWLFAKPMRINELKKFLKN